MYGYVKSKIYVLYEIMIYVLQICKYTFSLYKELKRYSNWSKGSVADLHPQIIILLHFLILFTKSCLAKT